MTIQNSFRIRVPGKLFLLGEYAILEPGSQALLLAVDRYLSADFLAAAEWQLQSNLEPDHIFTYLPESAQWQGPEAKKLPFAQAALEIAVQYLQALELPLLPQKIVLRSELQEGSLKLGLGSSAAVTVAIVAGILVAHGFSLEDHATRVKLFKLGILAHGAVQGGGSGADLAAAIFGSVTCYRRFDPRWLQAMQIPLLRLIDTDWALLGLEKLNWPQDWAFAVGWTGVPAATVDYLAEFTYVKNHAEELFQRFLFSANAATATAREALIHQNREALIQSLSQYRRLIQELEAEFIEPIETPALKALCQAAESLGLGAKSSGAGGGDCGVAVGDPAAISELENCWKASAIQPLRLSLDFQGVKQVPLA
ncbi:phosphomevalonate kinase [bacterium (Candidatus Blackallbacteria) CG17_big_fil_post_rev_8_21_14_2_50_48_46]|uniref:phosphomevalonate kinase n=1 Tax=bacterium (Candidatus Blackallbacteria) CG17_big_fil_post_rev_8_21_14_2_50_48_46 TaxID=2014261 RepID=A0A2M7G8G5_9BACT|nr:MAG: phosphomevalonate kinase [bacterium (Candidatus Blackallbacteria) CG18_big_fil_WC_8_21_14_2_50_49_26]PIW18308.1 MAG: phosphomevalonate kinase [bacterium (Candidatus Blackallbacteria) CG17_big_fil_post_rev_8_21_14_2_50_48_46]PIW49532.1 MAG: phosphomevalonate kinase [bacterium (Candidatus Blackallbacteria) CG13_big_fil_rev_8_21_14_2_50_49_14]